jgi:hypothetical protein
MNYVTRIKMLTVFMTFAPLFVLQDHVNGLGWRLAAAVWFCLGIWQYWLIYRLADLLPPPQRQGASAARCDHYHIDSGGPGG